MAVHRPAQYIVEPEPDYDRGISPRNNRSGRSLRAAAQAPTPKPPGAASTQLYPPLNVSGRDASPRARGGRSPARDLSPNHRQGARGGRSPARDLSPNHRQGARPPAQGAPRGLDPRQIRNDRRDVSPRRVVPDSTEAAIIRGLDPNARRPAARDVSPVVVDPRNARNMQRVLPEDREPRDLSPLSNPLRNLTPQPGISRQQRSQSSRQAPSSSSSRRADGRREHHRSVKDKTRGAKVGRGDVIRDVQGASPAERLPPLHESSSNPVLRSDKRDDRERREDRERRDDRQPKSHQQDSGRTVILLGEDQFVDRAPSPRGPAVFMADQDPGAFPQIPAPDYEEPPSPSPPSSPAHTLDTSGPAPSRTTPDWELRRQSNSSSSGGEGAQEEPRIITMGMPEGMGVPVDDTGVVLNDPYPGKPRGLIGPHKLKNPCKDSSIHRQLHREIAIKNKQGDLLPEKSELKQRFHQQRDKKIEQVRKEEKKKELMKSPFQQMVAMQAEKQKLREEKEKTEAKAKAKAAAKPVENEYEQIYQRITHQELMAALEEDS